MLSPEGIAVFYCRESVRERLRPSQQGWHMVDTPYNFNRNSWAPSKTATRFEAGSPNTLGQAAMHASIGLLQDFGMEQVEDNIIANSFTLSKGLLDIPGIELARPIDPQRTSGIVNFRPSTRDPVRIQQILKSRGLSSTVRANSIRLSPHFYQSGGPVLEMLDVIEDSVI
jgi:selenocysteine lyase/cysteine desulfurase